ncbi:MAG TPA: YlqD family protein [bacterium]|nr:YlqD family protein [bacterium]
MGITVSRPVVIKAVVTESFKRLYLQDLEEAMKRVDAIVQQIDTQIRRAELERQVSPQSRAVRQQLELERARQEATKAELSMRLREAQELALNSEFPQGTMESLVEVSVGDNLFDKIGRTELVVKDGIVLEIREER